MRSGGWPTTAFLTPQGDILTGATYLPADQIDSYIAGLILLAAAPCTAMVFVWSQLCKGDPYFTLSQVALNDSIMVVAFAPIVALLLGLPVVVFRPAARAAGLIVSPSGLSVPGSPAAVVPRCW